jgi:signal transduction histidine kinase/CheY-like chemotaxis protein
VSDATPDPATAPRRRTTLAARMLWRAAAFALVAFLLLATVELLIERAAQREDIHRSAVQATALALPSIERAVWAYDEPSLRVLADSLLREDSIMRVSVSTPDGTMHLLAQRPGAEDARALAWTRELRTPDHTEPMGTLEVTESFSAVDAQTLQRAAYRLPIELLKVLCIVLGMTLLVRALVVSRLSSLASQLRAFRADDDAQVTDRNPSAVEDEITTLADSLNGFLRQRGEWRTAALARERAEAASRAKTEFLSNMSHELRTPLNAIVGFAQALRDDGEVMRDPRRAERVALIGKAGQHLSRLIGDVLDLSRIESGSLRVVPQPVDLRAACSDAVALVRNEAETAGVRLALHLHPDARLVRADPTRLDQVLLNLLSNGVKYNRPGGHVALHARPLPDGEVEIRVEDDGLGMTSEQQAALFQPFNRLGRQASGKPGTGIGLVITRRLVDLMGGRLEVSSREGDGSQFMLRLPGVAPGGAAAARGADLELDLHAGPRTEAPAARPPGPTSRAYADTITDLARALAARDRAQAAAANVPNAPSGSNVVLYIEDEPVNVEVMRAVLSHRPGVEMVAASSIADGLAALRQRPPALLLLDIQLPDGDGLALLAHLRADPSHARLPVVVVSADALDTTTRRALAAGADRVLAKPYDFERLLALVDAHVGAAANASPASR